MNSPVLYVGIAALGPPWRPAGGLLDPLLSLENSLHQKVRQVYTTFSCANEQ